MTAPQPFDDSSFQVGDLTVESAADRVAIHGSLDLTRDADGLARARQLQAYLNQVVQTLEVVQRAGHLPAAVPVDRPTRRANPLAG